MSYIGKIPATGNFVKLDAITCSSTNTYNLLNGGVAFTPESVNHMLVSLNGVIQSPTTAYTVSGSQITFIPASGTLSSSDVIDFIMVYGNVLDIGTPSDNTVTASKLTTDSVQTAKIVDDAVTKAKVNFISDGTAGVEVKGDGGSNDGYIQLNCSQNSHGIKLKSPNHSAGQSYTLTFPATAPATDKFLKTDSSGVLSFADAGGGAWNLLSTTTVSSAVAQVDVTSNIDSTYKNYAFVLSDVHNATDDVRFQVQFFSSGGSPDTGSHYVYAGSGHRSDNAGLDMNSTGTTQGEISIAPCSKDAGHRHDQFVLYLFNPAGTDSYKMMISNAVQQLGNDKIGIGQIGITYAKTIAVTGVRFKMASGNIDRGIFKLYGIS